MMDEAEELVQPPAEVSVADVASVAEVATAPAPAVQAAVPAGFGTVIPNPAASTVPTTITIPLAQTPVTIPQQAVHGVPVAALAQVVPNVHVQVPTGQTMVQAVIPFPPPTQEKAKRNRQKSSYVWDYFEKSMNEGKSIVICKACTDKPYALSYDNSTSTMRYHLRAAHQINDTNEEAPKAMPQFTYAVAAAPPTSPFVPKKRKIENGPQQNLAGRRHVAIIVGVGPGLGGAVARKFATEGYTVAVISRSAKSLDPVHRSIEQEGGSAHKFLIDGTDDEAVQKTFTEIKIKLGDPEVLVYNLGALTRGSFLAVSPVEFAKSWRTFCYGAFLWTHHCLPDMVRNGKGTVIMTGATASMRGSAGFACMAVGKFGLRALSQSIAREFAPKGVHCVHVIIDGMIDAPREYAIGREPHTMMSADAIAESYFQLHLQHPSAWTQELDLRPNVEKF